MGDEAFAKNTVISTFEMFNGHNLVVEILK